MLKPLLLCYAVLLTLTASTASAAETVLDFITAKPENNKLQLSVKRPFSGSVWKPGMPVDIMVHAKNMDTLQEIPISVELWRKEAPWEKDTFIMHLFDADIIYIGNNMYKFQLPDNLWDMLEDRNVTNLGKTDRWYRWSKVFYLNIKREDKTRQGKYEASERKTLVRSKTFRIVPSKWEPLKEPKKAASELVNAPITSPVLSGRLKEHYDHITVFTVGTYGDVMPYISFFTELLKQADAEGRKRPTIRFATHSIYEERIKAINPDFEFRPIEGNPAMLMDLMVKHGMLTPNFIRAVVSTPEIRNFVKNLLGDLWAATDGTKVLLGTSVSLVGPHVAEARGIPYVETSTMTVSTNSEFPHAYVSSLMRFSNMRKSNNFIQRVINKLTYKIIETSINLILLPVANVWRRNHNLPPSDSIMLGRNPNSPMIYSFSSHLSGSPMEWNPDDNPHTYVTGFWFWDESPKVIENFLASDENKELLDFVEKNENIIYIGFGSVTLPTPNKIERAIVNAVKASGAKAIFSTGWKDQGKAMKDEAPVTDEELGDHILRWNRPVPHDWLFKQPSIVGAFIHGGAGTTANALRHGVPVLIHPFMTDQFIWAERVQRFDVGRYIKKFDQDKMTSAFKELTSKDCSMHKHTATLKTKLSTENGVTKAVKIFWKELENPKIPFRPLPIKRSFLIESTLSSKKLDKTTSAQRGSIKL